ncbi:MAG: MFS transporter [Chloroflexi bacterium]|nr:MFS transporter [Chloroflexota bacterium]
MGDQSAARAALGRIFGSLKYRDFKLLWIGNLATQASYWMFSVGLGWLVIQMEDTNRAGWLALLGVASGVPLLIFSLLGGVLADRFERKRLLMTYQAGSLVFISVFAALVAFDLVQMWHVLLIAFLFGVAQALNIPLRQALVPALVDRSDLLNATALQSAAWNAMRVVGPALAGMLIATVDTKGIFILMVPSYIWAMIWVAQMEIPPHPPRHRAVHPVRNLVDGLQFMRRDATILTLILTVTVPTLFSLPYMNFVPLFASDILQVGPGGLGVLQGAVGVGALIAALAMAGLTGTSRKGLWMIVVMVGHSVVIALFGLSLNYYVSIALLFVSGIAWSVMNALNSTLLQLATPDEYRGRVFSVYALTWGFQPLGGLLIGGLAEALASPAYAIAITSMVGAVLILLATVMSPHMRRME